MGRDGKRKTKGIKSIPGFFLQSNKDSKAKKSAISHKKAAVSNEKSSAVMNDLLKRLDNDEDVDEIGGKYEPEEEGNTAYNIVDQMAQKYDVAVPTKKVEEEKSAMREIPPAVVNIQSEDQEMVDDSNFDSINKDKNTPCAIISHKNGENIKVMNRTEDSEMVREDILVKEKEISSYDRANRKNSIHINEDNTLSVFLIDAHEEYNRPKEAFLFGKIFDPIDKEYRSICVRVQGIERIMYVVPKQEVDIQEVIDEMKVILRAKNIKNMRMRKVEKNYCFEMPCKKGLSEYLEVRYKTEHDSLPQNVKGKTFDHIFGKNTGILELLLVQKKIMGPRWINIKRWKEEKNYKASWCTHEIIVEEPKLIDCSTEDKNKPSPPLKVMTIAMKSFKNNRKTNEICMISCMMNDKVECDKQTKHPEKSNMAFSLVRKMEKLPYPYKFEEIIKKKIVPTSSFDREKLLLESFMTRVSKYDPDMLVAHGLCEGLFETLIDRIDKNRVSQWSRLGRFK